MTYLHVCQSLHWVTYSIIRHRGLTDMFKLHHAAIVSLLGAAAISVGCASKPDSDSAPSTVVTSTTTPAPPTTTVATPNGTVTTVPGAAVTNNTNAGPGSAVGADQNVGDEVDKAIHTNVQMTGSRITAVVTGGVARLTGTAQNAQQKALAEKAARDTAGVTSVINKVDILATGGVKSSQRTIVKKTVVNNVKVVYVPVQSPSAKSNSQSNSVDPTNGANAPSDSKDLTTAGNTPPSGPGNP